LKFFFRHGDAPSLLFGFDTTGKITGGALAVWPETERTALSVWVA